MWQYGDTIREFVIGWEYVAGGGSFFSGKDCHERLVIKRRIFHASLVLYLAHLFHCSPSARSAPYPTLPALFAGGPGDSSTCSAGWHLDCEHRWSYGGTGRRGPP